MRILSNQFLGIGVRFFNVRLSSARNNSNQNPPINKTLLAKLRKRTGYTFTNCKKALELNAYDLEKAEKWLANQAQALGWSKAMKLDGRPTLQGLIAVVVDKENAAIVEINCETDFVARNFNFQSMAQDAARACISFTKSQTVTGSPIMKFCLDGERLKQLPCEDGRPLADQLALVIGTVGENLSLRRAICLKAQPGLSIAGYAHPSIPKANTLLGKYGALVVFQETKPVVESQTEQLGRELCQHIVGMNPDRVGVVGEDIPSENVDDENCLIYQEYLLDPSLTVAQLLASTGVKIADFTRFECGENLADDSAETPIDLLIEQGG